MGTTKISANKIKTITKSLLIIDLKNKTGISDSDSELIINSLIDLIKSNLINKKSIMLKRIGTLAVLHKNSRSGVRNPITGEPMILKARNVVSLRHTHKDQNKIKTSDIEQELYNITKINKIKYSIIQESINIFLDTINNIKNGDYRIEIRGLGVFYPTNVDAKWSRNPKTGEKVYVERKIKLSFKASKVINSELNKK